MNKAKYNSNNNTRIPLLSPLLPLLSFSFSFWRKDWQTVKKAILLAEGILRFSHRALLILLNSLRQGLRRHRVRYVRSACICPESVDIMCNSASTCPAHSTHLMTARSLPTGQLALFPTSASPPSPNLHNLHLDLNCYLLNKLPGGTRTHFNYYFSKQSQFPPFPEAAHPPAGRGKPVKAADPALRNHFRWASPPGVKKELLQDQNYWQENRWEAGEYEG